MAKDKIKKPFYKKWWFWLLAITNENVQSDMYITISDGQYIKLQDVQIQK
ncbi:hypothetical protein ABE096_09115 [Robertmurraya massiliosenegalensis]